MTPGPLGRVTPWFVPEAVDWLDACLQSRERKQAAFEWGAGLSTVWLAARFEHVVTVESEPEWIAKVRADLQDYQLQDRVEFVPISAAAGGGYYLDYAAYLATRPESFDLISVDGRNRCDCLRQAAARALPGSYVVLDNSDRTHYLPAWQPFSGWPSWTFWARPDWATTIWHRPMSMPANVWVAE